MRLINYFIKQIIKYIILTNTFLNLSDLTYVPFIFQNLITLNIYLFLIHYVWSIKNVSSISLKLYRVIFLSSIYYPALSSSFSIKIYYLLLFDSSSIFYFSSFLGDGLLWIFLNFSLGSIVINLISLFY